MIWNQFNQLDLELIQFNQLKASRAQISMGDSRDLWFVIRDHFVSYFSFTSMSPSEVRSQLLTHLWVLSPTLDSVSFAPGLSYDMWVASSCHSCLAELALLLFFCKVRTTWKRGTSWNIDKIARICHFSVLERNLLCLLWFRRIFIAEMEIRTRTLCI